MSPNYPVYKICLFPRYVAIIITVYYIVVSVQ